MKMSKPLMVIAFFLMPLLLGCATNPELARNLDMRSLKKAYATQHYEECMDQVDQGLQSIYLTSGGRALLLLTKAFCLEETGDFTASDKIYHHVVNFVPNTIYSDRATKRLARVDGDQKEHFQIDLTSEHWRRASKDWTYQGCNSAYIPEGQTLKSADQMIFLVALDRLPTITAPIDFLERARAHAGLKGDRLEIIRVESASKNEGVWTLRSSKEDVIFRVILTKDRACCIGYARKGSGLSEADREHFLKKLNAAKIVSGA